MGLRIPRLNLGHVLKSEYLHLCLYLATDKDNKPNSSGIQWGQREVLWQHT